MESNSRRPVLLLHGIDDTRQLFHRLRRVLESDGWPVHTLDFAPNNGGVSLEELSEQIVRYAAAAFSPGASFDVVGFSMGGLVGRYFTCRHASTYEIKRLVTVAAPHRGSYTAFLRSNAGARQMRPGSSFLKELNRDSQPPAGVRFVSIWNPWDLMILPANSSDIAGAQSVRIPAIAHALMMRDRRVVRAVCDALSA